MVWLILTLLESCLIILFCILIRAQKKIYEKYRFAVLAGMIALVLLIPVFFFPYLFTTKCFMGIDFKNSGGVGDTIGGIMGPFVAIIAAFLTFIAFWVQYEANQDIRRDTKIERLENKFYEMLHLHRENLNEISIGTLKGRETIEFFYYELRFIYKIVEYSVTELENKPQEYSILSDREKKELMLKLAYGYFFHGKDYFLTRDKTQWRYNFCNDISNALQLNINAISQSVYSRDNRISQNEWKEFKRLIPKRYSDVTNTLLQGHHAMLGHYFRLLFNIVKLIAEYKDIEEEKKYGYIKILRAQLSDFEQVLIYYNSLSVIGRAWNTSLGESQIEKMCYIARFRFIKNIPFFIEYFGIKPGLFYVKEIGVWEKLGKSFFEQDIS